MGGASLGVACLSLYLGAEYWRRFHVLDSVLGIGSDSDRLAEGVEVSTELR